MGAQQKGIPLDIDYNEALTCRQEEGTPDLIITGKKKRDDDKGGGGGGDEEEDKEGVPMYVRRALKESENTFSSRQGSDQADEDKISCLTDDELNQTINKYTNHLRLNLKDKGEKIRTFLDKLKQEKETRRHQKNEASRNCNEGGRDYSNLSSRYIATGNSLINPPKTAFTGDWDFVHKRNKVGAFDFEVALAKGMSYNEYSQQTPEKMRGTCNHTSNGQKAVTSLIPVADCGKKNDFASKEILGKRPSTFHGCNQNVANVTSDFVQSCTNVPPKKKFTEEVHSGQDTRSVTRSSRKRDSIGASLDTAMELSDDEEKLESGHPENEDYLHDYHLRSKSRGAVGFRFAYPRDDPEAVEVQQSDLRHLDPYEFLNDTVIDFYIKYIQRPENLSEERKLRFHFFNTFFFKKLLLEKPKGRSSDCYSKLRKWVRGVNIFEKYLLVPIHESAHWSLVIVCFSFEEESKMQPYILHLDSMKDGHVTEKVVQILESYLKAEWHHMGGIDGVDRNWDAVSERVHVPLQQNAWDCGLFLLFFIQRFVEDAPLEFTANSLNSMFGRNWFKPQEASKLRISIKNLLRTLVKEQNVEIMMEDMD